MLQNEALAKIESVNLQALEVLQSSAESLNKISEAVKPVETTTAAAVQPEIVIESDDRRSATTSESSNYAEELMSIGLEQVRVLEFILKEVKNGNSRMSSVSDSIQQLSEATSSVSDSIQQLSEAMALVSDSIRQLSAVMSELEASGTERLAAEEARREAPKGGLVDRLMPSREPKKEESGLFGKILGGLAIIGTLAAGFISGLVSSVKSVFSSVTALFAENFPRIFTAVKTFFVDLGAKIATFFKESKVFEGIRKVFAGAGGIFSKIGGFFGQIGTFLSEAWAAIKGKFPMLSKIGSIGRILGKLALPITAILGVFDAVKAGLEEFNVSGDIGKSIGEGVKGLVKSVIGAPLDLLKSVVSWIAGKLGFDGVESFLDSFSFSDLLGVFVQRIIDWGRGIFEKFFGTIYDVFTDISSGFDKGPLEGMLEILRGVLKTLIASPLDMVKNTIASAAGFVGASGVEEYLRSFSFTKMAGGTHTETLGEQKTSGKSAAEEARDITAARRLKEAADEVANEIMADEEEKKDVLDSIKNPITVFYDALIKAYQENSAGTSPQAVQAMPSSVGAEISAMQSNTADLESEAQMSGPATVVAPQSRTVNNSNQSVTYNSNNIPDRTTWMTTPLSSWIGV